MRFQASCLAWLSCSLVAAVTTVTNDVVFSPPSNYLAPKTLYGRSVELADGSILATWENYSPEPPQVYFPIYKSTDGGKTYSGFSSVHDTQNGWGLRYQPFLYVLPAAFAGYAKGDILLAGNSIPSDLSQTRIELYASRNGGSTWSFVSHIASGGVAQPVNGKTPVWEPFLMLHNNQLVVYYSDQRDPAHGQKVVHQVSSNAISWGSVVNDVASNDYSLRPGMPSVSSLPNGKWILSFEKCSTKTGCIATYILASDPLNFAAGRTYTLRSTDGTIPSSSPYNVWTPYGGPNGTLIMNAASDTAIFVNHANGDPNEWLRYIQLMSGGTIGAKSNQVTTAILDLAQYI
ncbi:hypothetical protein MBLNU459_g6471t1 [Dothideomycetes sp. NU459]